MVHKLAMVALAGITISAVCLGAGGALEGRGFGGFSIFDHWSVSCTLYRCAPWFGVVAYKEERGGGDDGDGR